MTETWSLRPIPPVADVIPWPSEELELPGKIKKKKEEMSGPGLNTEGNKLVFDPVSKEHSWFSQMRWPNPKYGCSQSSRCCLQILLSCLLPWFCRESYTFIIIILQLQSWVEPLLFIKLSRREECNRPNALGSVTTISIRNNRKKKRVFIKPVFWAKIWRQMTRTEVWLCHVFTECSAQVISPHCLKFEYLRSDNN